MKTVNNGNKYQDVWENRSSIRTSPRKTIDFEKKGFFFPPNKQLLLLLPEVYELGENVRNDILLHSFYKYLNDIVNLEIQLINSACNYIISNDLVVKYGQEVKINAYTVIIDEYYHVYLAQDMICQIDDKFPTFKKLPFPDSDAYNAVNTIIEKLDAEYKEMFIIIAVCIFETTVVRELIEFFDDPEVHTSIRYYINDHMNDESKHYNFFYNLLNYTWKNLPENYKKNIGRYLVDFIRMYLNIESEKAYNKLILTSILNDEKQSQSLINKVYSTFNISPDIPMVKHVLNVLKSLGIMDCEFVKQHFIDANLYI